MKVAVCVKWVPALARMKFDPETRRIVREGVPHELNGYDQLAIQRAIELKQSHNAEVTAFTMGPPQARQGLVQCLAWGVDQVFHIVDRALAGSDTLATSRALSLALGRESFDLVLFGAHSLDAETGQVGPQVAEFMDIPQVTGVRKLEITGDGATLILERELDDGIEVVETPMPCVVAVTEGVAPEVFPAREKIAEAREKEIPEITAADLSDDLSIFGEGGSPTWVSEIRIVESHREQRVIEGASALDAVREIIEFVRKRGLLAKEARVIRKEFQSVPSIIRSPQGEGVWVVAEIGSLGITPITKELLGAAHKVADAIKGHVVALLIGGKGVTSHCAELGFHGADVVYVAEAERLENYATDSYAKVLSEGISRYAPYAVLLASTVNGRDLAARVAARLRLGLTGDCIGLEVDSENRLVQLKPAFGGNIVAPIFSKTKPYMATVRPGLLSPVEPNVSRNVRVEAFGEVSFPDPSVRSLGFKLEDQVDVADLDNAWALVGIGMGLGGPENLKEIEPLTELLDAEVICTRDVVEAGWLPKQRQVGITGRSFGPNLYIGVGVRGDFNHTVGIQRSGTVIAINNNPRATIFRQADLGVVSDWQSIIPCLVQELKNDLETRG